MHFECIRRSCCQIVGCNLIVNFCLAANRMQIGQQNEKSRQKTESHNAKTWPGWNSTLAKSHWVICERVLVCVRVCAINCEKLSAKFAFDEFCFVRTLKLNENNLWLENARENINDGWLRQTDKEREIYTESRTYDCTDLFVYINGKELESLLASRLKRKRERERERGLARTLGNF